MKAILEFDLDNPDDKLAHLRAIKALDMTLVLWEMEHNCYREITRDDDSDEYKQGVIETLEYLRELMKDKGIIID